MITVSQSMKSETKNHAIPSVMIAIGNVISLRIGLRIVFRIPKTAAGMITVQAEPWNVTPESSQPVRPSTIAFPAHESSSHLSTKRILTRGSDRRRRVVLDVAPNLLRTLDRLEPRDEVERHVDPGGYTRGGDDLSL